MWCLSILLQRPTRLFSWSWRPGDLRPWWRELDVKPGVLTSLRMELGSPGPWDTGSSGSSPGLSTPSRFYCIFNPHVMHSGRPRRFWFPCQVEGGGGRSCTGFSNDWLIFFIFWLIVAQRRPQVTRTLDSKWIQWRKYRGHSSAALFLLQRLLHKKCKHLFIYSNCCAKWRNLYLIQNISVSLIVLKIYFIFT